MKKFLTWFFLLSKRQLNNIFFIIILSIMPLLAFYVKDLDNIDVSIDIGLYDADNTTLSCELTNSFSSSLGVINYNIYTNEDALKEAILQGEVQCGYIINKGFSDSINKSITTDLLTILQKPNSSIVLVSNELIFSDIFEIEGYYELLKDINDSNIFSNITEEDISNLKDNYHTYLSNGETFRFNFGSTKGTYVSSNSINALDYIKTPIRALGSILVFMAALSGGFTYLKDKQNGFKSYMCIFDISIPVFFCGICGILSTYIAKINGPIIKEAAIMIIYSFLVIAFVFLLTHFISNMTLYCSTIPIFAIGSLVCCPVFFNIASFVPAMKVVSLCFAPTYYIYLSNLIL